MDIVLHLQNIVANAISELFDLTIGQEEIVVNATKKEFEGEYTVVLFPIVKKARRSPAQIGQELGDYLVKEHSEIDRFQVVSGFLNISLAQSYWDQVFQSLLLENALPKPPNGKKIMIEYSSPNTNKPLHLGHIRNILLGWSCSQMYQALGYEVIKTQVINDRGIAICKSMWAWQQFGEGKSPDEVGMKPDHYVGKFYVRYSQVFQEEYLNWQQSDIGRETLQSKDSEQSDNDFWKAYENQYFNLHSEIGKAVRKMLIQWENNDSEVIRVWQMMNGWVYEGFDQTYAKLGVEFDVTDYESQTYLLGKETIESGLQEGIFFRKPDGSVWIDLTDVGMDEKILLRSNGTSVYMTQDLGTAQSRFDTYGFNRMVYVVGDEQDYHFKVLFEILKRCQVSYANDLYHLSYGMIDLPTGKMKSREGTIVDADDLIKEVMDIAAESATERGEISDLTPEAQQEVVQSIAMGALKFFIIKINPKKRMIFNPAESMDLQGQTGPYIQNAYVRIQSILRKAQDPGAFQPAYELLSDEKELISQLLMFESTVEGAAHNFDPSSLANYLYALAKRFHKYYHDVRILSAETEEARSSRIALINQVASTLEYGFSLLGIQMPERM